jgi:hypothetical protein
MVGYVQLLMDGLFCSPFFFDFVFGEMVCPEEIV